MYHLHVVQPFADYAVGDQITDQEKVQEILAGHNVHHVVKVKAPEPEAAKAKK
ncbi:MAG: hypothetical protein JO142_02230 [Burkholderiales bacterium]|nr:hypothetical protein [Burkholderiales bacterium]